MVEIFHPVIREVEEPEVSSIEVSNIKSFVEVAYFNKAYAPGYVNLLLNATYFYDKILGFGSKDQLKKLSRINIAELSPDQLASRKLITYMFRLCILNELKTLDATEVSVARSGYSVKISFVSTLLEKVYILRQEYNELLDYFPIRVVEEVDKKCIALCNYVRPILYDNPNLMTNTIPFCIHRGEPEHFVSKAYFSMFDRKKRIITVRSDCVPGSPLLYNIVDYYIKLTELTALVGNSSSIDMCITNIREVKAKNGESDTRIRRHFKPS